MGGRGASSAGGTAVGGMSDARLKSERARAAKAESAAQDRLRAASLEMRRQDNSDASREKWNAANAAAKAARSRLGAIDDEMLRRSKAAEPARLPVSEEARKRNVERAKLRNYRSILVEEQARKARKEAKRAGTGRHRGKR